MPAMVAQRQQQQQGDVPVRRGIPFFKASNRFAEKFFTDAITVTANQQPQTPHLITPGGFLRKITLNVVGTAGALNTAVVGSDFPFSLFATITLEDINGAPIIGPLTGYELYLLNKYGQFSYANDPTVSFGFNRTYTSSLYFDIDIPVEIRSDGWGALPNTDARAQYRLNYTIDSGIQNSNILSTGTVTTALGITVTGFVEYWNQVNAQNEITGEHQETVPPLLDTTQFCVHESYPISNASLTIKHNRVGNLVRWWAYLGRSGAAATGSEQANPRAEVLADPVRVRLDNRYLRTESPNLRRKIMADSYGLNGAAVLAPAAAQTVPIVDTGVYVYPFHRGIDGHPSPGDEAAYLQTTEATFLQLEDAFVNSPSGATLTILTNDVAVPSKHRQNARPAMAKHH